MSNPHINVGHGILEVSQWAWKEDYKTKQPVKHVILTMLPVENVVEAPETPPPTSGDAYLGYHFNNALKCDVLDISPADPVEGLSGMEDYAAKVAEALPRRPEPLLPSPFDIPVQQGWLLIELDPDINWRFTKGQVPCTLKAQDLRGENIQLRHAYVDEFGKGQIRAGAVHSEDCKVIFFGVRRRGGAPHQAGDPDLRHCYVNLNIEFLQDHVNSKPTRYLQLIVDPDVPNSGSSEFP